jgi:hypothetical protein
MDEIKRATIYFDAEVGRALRLRAAACKRSISDIESQRVHGPAAERGHDLDAVDLAVSVGILLQLLKLPAIQQLAQRRDLTAGIGGVGALGDGHTQAVGVEAHLGDKTPSAGGGFID